MTRAASIARRAARPITGSNLVLTEGGPGDGGSFHAFVAACPISRKLIGPEVLRLNYRTSVNILAAATILMDDEGNGHASSVIYSAEDPSLPSFCTLWSVDIAGRPKAGAEDILWIGEQDASGPEDLTLRFTLHFALCREGQDNTEAHLEAMAAHLASEMLTIAEGCDKALGDARLLDRPLLQLAFDRAGCVEVLCRGFTHRFARRVEAHLSSWKHGRSLAGLADVQLDHSWAAAVDEAA